MDFDSVTVLYSVYLDGYQECYISHRTVSNCRCVCVSSATAWSEKLPQTLLFCFPISSHEI